MNQFKHDEIIYFQFTTFPATSRSVRHAVLGRQGGVSPAPYASLNLSSAVGDDPAHYEENRRRAYGLLGRAFASLVHAKLVHGAEVAVVGRGDHGRVLPQCDALISNDLGCGLTMNYADCAPIFIYDPEHHAIGLGHAGWGGAVKDVPGAMVRAMVATFGSRPAALWAGIGPCIGVEVYEVGEVVVTAVQQAFTPTEVEQLLIPQPDSPRPHFDLARANELNLRRAGVQTIEQANLCTVQNNHLFFSHRAEHGRAGRFGTLFLLDE
jgi:polyphenol oxidase